MSERRLGLVRVTLEAVPALLERGVNRRLPDGARVLSVHSDFARHCLTFVVEHPSFPMTPEGLELPEVGLEPAWQFDNSARVGEFFGPTPDSPFIRGEKR
jgi:hypothetical protein